MKRAIAWLSALMILILLTAGCTISGGNEGGLEVTDLWGRSSPQAAQNGAFYMKISNNGREDDELLGARTDACGSVELHEMFMKENDVMGMRQVPGGTLAIPAGETVELKVGGMHVMCIGKQQEFNVGDKIPLVLEFSNAGEMELTADIRETEMGSMSME